MRLIGRVYGLRFSLGLEYIKATSKVLLSVTEEPGNGRSYPAGFKLPDSNTSIFFI